MYRSPVVIHKRVLEKPIIIIIITEIAVITKIWIRFDWWLPKFVCKVLAIQSYL